MGNIASIMGGAWAPQEEKRVDAPETQLMDAMSACGLEPPDHIIMDGKVHRFRSGTKGQGGQTDKPGWYVVFGDGDIPAGRFGCWRAGVEQTWRADIGRTLSADELAAYQRRMEEARLLREAELKRQRETSASVVQDIWGGCMAADAGHPYLVRKGIDPHGARVTGDGRLVLPLYSPDGELTSLQYIAHDGGKMYHSGGQVGGSFWWVGTFDAPGAIYVAEGYATAATIHEATHRPTLVAYSASNLVPVVASMRERMGDGAEIVVVADNDKSGTGQRYAEQASAKYGCRVVMPPMEGMDANDYAQAGYDLNALLNPPAASEQWLVGADDFSAQPAPIRWLVKGWLQDQALMMVHGPSGGGKTFVVLDWCLRMAAKTADWCGQKVKPGPVVYLAGEGHHGLRGRIAAWKAHHGAQGLDMWLSRGGCDLNTPEGYLKALQAIQALPAAPSLIVVDTLHRFLNGDENSAQDAKIMLDACAGLMEKFKCSAMLVHHTGVNEESQHRARGSSAWRGALDIEISVVPAKNDEPMQIVQRKSKDAELAQPVYARLKSVQIPGWLDEDGEPVTSAVLEQSHDEPSSSPANRKESKLASHIKTFTNCWFGGGVEDRNGYPYISRSAMLAYLVNGMGLSEASAKQYVKPSVDGKMVHDLLQAGVLEPLEHGWVVVDGTLASSLLMAKNSKNPAA